VHGGKQRLQRKFSGTNWLFCVANGGLYKVDVAGIEAATPWSSWGA